MYLSGSSGKLRLAARRADGSIRTLDYDLRWISTNLAGSSADHSLFIRAGDSLRLSVTAPAGIPEIDRFGDAQSVPVNSGEDLIATYGKPGSFPVSASAQGQPLGGLRLDVLSVSMADSGRGLPSDSSDPVLFYRDYGRSKPIGVWPPDLGQNIAFMASSPGRLRASLAEEKTKPDELVLNMQPQGVIGTTETLYLQARLGGSHGPILDSHPIRSLEVHSSASTMADILSRSEDGTLLCGATFTMAPLYPGVDIVLGIWGEGGTFADSTTSYRFTSQDLDEDGELFYRMIWPKGGSVCHVIKISQNGMPLN